MSTSRRGVGATRRDATCTAEYNTQAPLQANDHAATKRQQPQQQQHDIERRSHEHTQAAAAAAAAAVAGEVRGLPLLSLPPCSTGFNGKVSPSGSPVQPLTPPLGAQAPPALPLDAAAAASSPEPEHPSPQPALPTAALKARQRPSSTATVLTTHPHRFRGVASFWAVLGALQWTRLTAATAPARAGGAATAAAAAAPDRRQLPASHQQELAVRGQDAAPAALASHCRMAAARSAVATPVSHPLLGTATLLLLEWEEEELEQHSTAAAALAQQPQSSDLPAAAAGAGAAGADAVVAPTLPPGKARASSATAAGKPPQASCIAAAAAALLAAADDSLALAASLPRTARALHWAAGAAAAYGRLLLLGWDDGSAAGMGYSGGGGGSGGGWRSSSYGGYRGSSSGGGGGGLPLLMCQEARDAALSALHERWAARLTEVCRANGGVYVKAGQFAAAFGAVPPEYRKHLALLQDKARPRPFRVVDRVLRRELGAPCERVFAEFSAEATAAASLAQVHRARLSDGTPVAVKVQYPGLASAARADLATLTALAAAAGAVFPGFKLRWLADDLCRKLHEELDFYVEIRNAQRLMEFLDRPWGRSRGRANSRANSSSSAVAVPRAHVELCTSRVLTMEWVDGVKISDGEAMATAGISPGAVGRAVEAAFARMVFGHGYVHADPHPGNLMVRPSGRPGLLSWLRTGSWQPFQLVLLDHGSYLTVPPDLRRRYAQLWAALFAGDSSGAAAAAIDLGGQRAGQILPVILTQRGRNREEQRAMQRAAGVASFGDVSQLLASAPRDVVELLRIAAVVRAVTAALGMSLADRLRISASWALAGLGVTEFEETAGSATDSAHNGGGGTESDATATLAAAVAALDEDGCGGTDRHAGDSHASGAVRSACDEGRVPDSPVDAAAADGDWHTGPGGAELDARFSRPGYRAQLAARLLAVRLYCGAAAALQRSLLAALAGFGQPVHLL